MKASLMLGIMIFLTTFSVYGAESLHFNDRFLEKVTAIDIREKIINNKEVDYHDAIILGDLDLSDLPMKAVNSNLRIVDSTFKGSINFNDIVFCGIVDLSGSAFNDNVSFMGAKFDKYASFEGANFSKNAKFGSSEFQGDANFKRAKFSDDEDHSSDFAKIIFNSTVNFWKSRFGIAYFNYAKFNDSSNFLIVKFLKDVDFGDAYFHKETCFKGSKFLENALFCNTEFNGDADFRQTSFEKEAYFYPAIFNNISSFSQSTFLGNANFWDSIFRGYTDFEGINSKGDAIFWNASFGENNLSLKGSKFSRIIARWNDLEDALIFNEIIYSALIKNFKDLGRTGDANDCYYDYRTEKPKDGLIAWAIDGLSWASCGYGVKPEFTIFWCMVLILSFAIIFWDGNGIKPTNSLQPDSTVYISKIFGRIGNQQLEFKILKSIPKRAWDKMRTSYFLKCIYFSATVFIAAKSEDFSSSGRYKYLVTLERILGWFFFALFVGAMTRTILG